MARRGVRRFVLPVVMVVASIGSFHAAHAAPPPPVIDGVSPSIITPYLSGGCLDINLTCYRISGSSDPATVTKVFVTIADEFGLSFTAQAVVATEDDPGAGISKGDWFASPNVTNMGVHQSSESNPLGDSILTFTAVAEDAAGNRSDPTPPVTAIKQAATQDDITAPTLTRFTNASNDDPPPSGENWCRNRSCGTQFPDGSGRSLYQALELQGSPCQPGYALVFGTQLGCSHDMLIRGKVVDATSAARGIASEIADVLITVTRQSDNVIVKQYHAAIRTGTSASFVVALSISDYEDNQTYKWKAEAWDAHGHPSNVVDGTFKVTP